MADQSPPRRLRFRLRTLFILMTVVACLTMLCKGLYDRRTFREDVIPMWPDVDPAKGIFTGEAERYWWDHSVVMARVVSVADGGTRYMGIVDTNLRLQSLGTLSGPFDCGSDAEVMPPVEIGEDGATV